MKFGERSNALDESLPLTVSTLGQPMHTPNAEMIFMPIEASCENRNGSDKRASSQGRFNLDTHTFDSSKQQYRPVIDIKAKLTADRTSVTKQMYKPLPATRTSASTFSRSTSHHGRMQIV